jgi:hypothetical protein
MATYSTPTASLPRYIDLRKAVEAEIDRESTSQKPADDQRSNTQKPVDHPRSVIDRALTSRKPGDARRSEIFRQTSTIRCCCSRSRRRRQL